MKVLGSWTIIELFLLTMFDDVVEKRPPRAFQQPHLTLFSDQQDVMQVPTLCFLQRKSKKLSVHFSLCSSEYEKKIV